MARKRQAWKPGDVFVVPLEDASFALGQVVAQEPRALNSVVMAFFDHHFEERPIIFNGHDMSHEHTLSVQFVTRDLLDNHTWKVIGKSSVDKRNIPSDLDVQREAGFVGTTIRGSGIMRRFLSAYFSLMPWNQMADPVYFDKLLISRDRKPRQIILKAKPARSPSE